ncbi:MAG: MATE family efflux transporter [Candidatus Paceibacterota bacterium]|jgi:putative MATE family efflux protein|nr:MATE family efflux transporter [Candidatus Paceibacterota bacterium]
MNNNSLTEGSVLKSLLSLSVPIIATNLLHTAYQLTDTFWVGRLGASAIAAVSISFPIIFFFIAWGGGMAMAGSILVAQYKGKSDQGAVNHIATQTLLFILVVAVFLSAIGYFFAPHLINLMGAEPDVYEDAVSYLKISLIGITFLFIYIMFQSLMRGVGKVNVPMFIVLGTVLLNLIFDPLFIFGWGSFPAMGVSGAALSSILTQGLSAAIGIYLLFRKKGEIRIRWSELKPDFPLIKKMFNLGLPASIEQSSRSILMIIMMFLVVAFGTVVTAAYGIGTRMMAVVIIPAIGLSMATSALVGQNMGAGKIYRAEKIAKISAAVGFAVLSLAGVLMFFFAEHLAGFFVPGEPEAIGQSVQFLRLMSFAFGFIAVHQVISGVFRGAGNTITSMVLTLVSLWVLLLPLAYFLSQRTSLAETGIWIAFPVADIIATVVTIIWFLRGTWKNKKITEEVKIKEKIAEEAIIEEGIN